jgi:glutamate dehydrogenase
MDRWLAPHERDALEAQAAPLVAQGVPAELAQRVARLESLFAALDIVEVGAETGCTVDAVAGVYFGIGGRLDLAWVSRQVTQLPVESRWQALARVALRDDLTAIARALARSALGDGAPAAGGTEAPIDAWEAGRAFQLARCRALLADMKSGAAVDMAMLSVLLRELRALV